MLIDFDDIFEIIIQMTIKKEGSLFEFWEMLIKQLIDEKWYVR